MRKPQLGFAARETASGTYTFQAVLFTASRTGQSMSKTLDPHAKLLTGGEIHQLGYDPHRIIERARRERIGLPAFAWRHHVVNWQDLW